MNEQEIKEIEQTGWHRKTTAKCVEYICAHANSKEFKDEVYKYQEQDRLSTIPVLIMNMYNQYNAVVAQNKSLQGELRLANKIIDIMLQELVPEHKTTTAYEDSKIEMACLYFEGMALQELEAEND